MDGCQLTMSRYNSNLLDIHRLQCWNMKVWKDSKAAYHSNKHPYVLAVISLFCKAGFFYIFISQMLDTWSQPLFSLHELQKKKKMLWEAYFSHLHMTSLTKPCLELSRGICITQLSESMCKLHADWLDRCQIPSVTQTASICRTHIWKPASSMV